MDVTLHLGAHRTGTTTLQRYLETKRDQLAELGTEFWGPKQTRTGLLDGLQKNPNKLTDDAILRGNRSCEKIRDALRRLESDGVKSVIISEENMIGSMWGNLSNTSLYPEAGGRLQRFVDGFEGRCKRVVFSVRSYEDYWASVLTFLINSGRAIPTLEQIHELAAQPRRWRDVLTEISSAFPAAELVVYSFETMAGRLPDQLALLNGDMAPLPTDGRLDWHNASVGGSKLRQVLIEGGHNALAAKIPEGSTRWQPYDAQQIATFQKLYAQDIAWLRGGADGIAKFKDNPQ